MPKIGVRNGVAIRREYERANRAINIMLRRKDKGPWFQELWGARQALAWVLNEPAMAPVLASVPHLNKRLNAKHKTREDSGDAHK